MSFEAVISVFTWNGPCHLSALQWTDDGICFAYYLMMEDPGAGTVNPGTAFMGESAAETAVNTAIASHNDLRAAGVATGSFLTVNYLVVAPKDLGDLPSRVSTLLRIEPRLRLSFSRKDTMRVWWGPDEETTYGSLSLVALERVWVAQTIASLKVSKLYASSVKDTSLLASTYVTEEGKALCAVLRGDPGQWASPEEQKKALDSASEVKEGVLGMGPRFGKCAAAAWAGAAGKGMGWLEPFLCPPGK